MATMRVTYTFPEGGTLTAVVKGQTNYPDALNEMRSQVKKLWTDAWELIPDAESGDDE